MNPSLVGYPWPNLEYCDPQTKVVKRLVRRDNDILD